MGTDQTRANGRAGHVALTAAGESVGADVRGLRRFGTTRERDAREQLVRAQLPLVEVLARRFASDVEGLDDLRQVALIGLLKAFDRYDPHRGVPFAAFAVPTILGELRHHVRDRTWPVRVPRRVRRLEVELRRPARVAVPLAESAGVAAPDQIAESENRLLVESLLRVLGSRERTIVGRYFFAGRSQAQIARELGISQIHVSRLLRAALTTMREQLEGAPVS
jgi:RNA polymerase sigma-B factor